MSGRKFQRKLGIVFEKAAPISLGQPADYRASRYVPRALSAAGSGWGVWDRLASKYLTDVEIMRLSDDKLRFASVAS